nr:hypothetical protein [Tanacetum cinerariifolium]
MTYVHALPLVSEALSPVCADLIPSPKKVRDIGYLADVEEGAIKVTYETLRDLVQRFHDHTEAIPVHRVQVTKGVQREQGHRIVGVDSAVTALTERVAELERDNRRLRGTTRHIPPLPAISPFLSSDDDTTDSDTPDTPPSPTHDTPFTEIATST